MLGTRPEIIKLGLLMRHLGPTAWVIHTGQHYDAAMSQVFFDAFGLPAPETTLGVGGSSRGEQIGAAVAALDRAFAHRPPAVVVVQGDTNSTVAGALAANAALLPLLHVEAGLRSHDRRMPEEHNRIIADHLADVCCAPTEVNRANLRAEGIPDTRIVLTGNPIVEAVAALLPPPPERSALAARLGVTPGAFVLSTFHRPENVDDPAALGSVMRALADLPLPVVLPLHPRTQQHIATAGVTIGETVHVVAPLGYAEFLGLAACAALLVSDSGGIQGEASILKKPVLVVRRSTERPEVLGTFARLVSSAADLGREAAALLADPRPLDGLPTPYGDGTASERIAGIVRGLAA